MLIAMVSAIVALACLYASARRVLFVHEATRHDLQRLVEELRGDAGARREAWLSAALAAEDDTWEGAVVRALAEPEVRVRVGELNEQLTELDFQLTRWSRVPRVCASLSSSVGFLLAALLLRRGLVDPTALSGDVPTLVTTGLVGQALTVVGFGLAGAVGCAALQARANRAARAGSEAADELVDRLDTLAKRRREGEAGESSESSESSESKRPLDAT